MQEKAAKVPSFFKLARAVDRQVVETFLRRQELSMSEFKNIWEVVDMMSWLRYAIMSDPMESCPSIRQSTCGQEGLYLKQVPVACSMFTAMFVSVNDICVAARIPTTWRRFREALLGVYCTNHGNKRLSGGCR